MKRQYTIILAVLIMFFYNVASGTPFLDCGSETGKLTNMEVSGCNTTSDACVLKRGTKAPIKIGFTVSKEVTAVSALAYGGNSDYFFPLLRPSNGCVNTGLKCPLQKGTNHEFKVVWNVTKEYLTGSYLVQYKLYDQNSEIIVCAEFLAKIMD